MTTEWIAMKFGTHISVTLRRVSDHKSYSNNSHQSDILTFLFVLAKIA